MRYRVLDDGALEAVVQKTKHVEIISVDRLGVASLIETLPSKRFKIESVRGADATWHSVIPRDPTD